MLGADLAYMGTRFIATREAGVDPAYHQLLVEGTSSEPDQQLSEAAERPMPPYGGQILPVKQHAGRTA